MKLSAQEEYGLRCLLRVAHGATDPSCEPVSIRAVAEAEGLSSDYAAKLLRVLRCAGLLESERGACGGYRLARPPADIPLDEVFRALDTPLYGEGFCELHAGAAACCAHQSACALRPLWSAIQGAIGGVLARLTVADLLHSEPVVRARIAAPRELVDG